MYAHDLLIQLTPPDAWGDHSVSESHGSRLEDVGNLRIDCRVVPSPVEVGTVSFVHGIRDLLTTIVDKLARDEDGHPFVVDYVLVGGDSELTCTVEQPLVLIILLNIIRSVLVELSGPPLVHTVPQNTHGQQEGILITTRITNGYRGRKECSMTISHILHYNDY